MLKITLKNGVVDYYGFFDKYQCDSKSLTIIVREKYITKYQMKDIKNIEHVIE